MPCMRGEAAAIASTFFTPSAVSRIAWIRIGRVTLVARLELRQQLVEIVDVPRPLDLGQHHHVELVAGRRDDLGDVVERPGAVQRIDAGPQAGRAEVVRARHLDEAGARRLLGVGRDRVLQVAEHHVDLADQLADLGADLLHMRRHEMDHALEPHRQLAVRGGCADRERLEEGAGEFHGTVVLATGHVESCNIRCQTVASNGALTRRSAAR